MIGSGPSGSSLGGHYIEHLIGKSIEVVVESFLVLTVTTLKHFGEKALELFGLLVAELYAFP